MWISLASVFHQFNQKELEKKSTKVAIEQFYEGLSTPSQPRRNHESNQGHTRAKTNDSVAVLQVRIIHARGHLAGHQQGNGKA